MSTKYEAPYYAPFTR